MSMISPIEVRLEKIEAWIRRLQQAKAQKQKAKNKSQSKKHVTGHIMKESRV
jgi:hypothetical protein